MTDAAEGPMQVPRSWVVPAAAGVRDISSADCWPHAPPTAGYASMSTRPVGGVRVNGDVTAETAPTDADAVVQTELPLTVDWADDDTPAATEREMLDLLHGRYRVEYGRRYVCAEHVRNRAGLDATRTADFVAMDLWPSAGLLLHGHEVKVSRSDWLRELADPAKADAFRRYTDRWWLVVPHIRVVRDDLPDGWGLMVRRGGRLAVVVPAPKLTPQPIPRTFLASLLRAAVATAERRMREGVTTPID